MLYDIFINTEELLQTLLVVGFYKIDSELECLSFTLLDMNTVCVTLNAQYTYIMLPAASFDEAVWSAIWCVSGGNVARTVSKDKRSMRIYRL